MPALSFEQLILELFEELGIPPLTDEQKSLFVPEYLARLQERIGIIFMSKLSPEHTDTFHDMLQSDDTEDHHWYTFWTEAIPRFEEEFAFIFADFAADVKRALA